VALPHNSGFKRAAIAATASTNPQFPAKKPPRRLTETLKFLSFSTRHIRRKQIKCHAKPHLSSQARPNFLGGMSMQPKWFWVGLQLKSQPY
jgi:hypothetical protein